MGQIDIKADPMETANYKGIPAMSPPEVHAYLTELGLGSLNAGVAMEVGCWLGATSAALLAGLVEAGYYRQFWAFDRWKANPSEVRKAKEQGVDIMHGQDTSLVYHKNVSPFYKNLKMVRGRVPNKFQEYSGDPIEFCMFDAPKKNPVFKESIQFVEPYFIPGVTVLGLMDYYFYRSRRDLQQNQDWCKFLAPVKFMDTYSDHFTPLKEFPHNGSCAFFRFEKHILWKK